MDQVDPWNFGLIGVSPGLLQWEVILERLERGTGSGVRC